MSNKEYYIIDDYEEELSEDDETISFHEEDDIEELINDLIFEAEEDKMNLNHKQQERQKSYYGFVDDYVEYSYDGIDGSFSRANRHYPTKKNHVHKLKDKYSNLVEHRTLDELQRDFYKQNVFKKGKSCFDESLNEFKRLKALLSRSLIEDYKESKTFKNKHKPFKMDDLKSYYEKYGVISKNLKGLPIDENWSVEFLTKKVFYQYERISKFMIGYLDFNPTRDVSGKDFRASERESILLSLVELTYLLHAFKFNLSQGSQVSLIAPYFKDESSIFNQEQNCLMLMNLLMDLVINVEDFIDKCPNGKVTIISMLQSIKQKYAPYFIFVLDYYLPLTPTKSDCDEFLLNNSKYFTFDTVKVLSEQERSMDKRKIAEQLRSLK